MIAQFKQQAPNICGDDIDAACQTTVRERKASIPKTINEVANENELAGQKTTIDTIARHGTTEKENQIDQTELSDSFRRMLIIDYIYHDSITDTAIMKADDQTKAALDADASITKRNTQKLSFSLV